MDSFIEGFLIFCTFAKVFSSVPKSFNKAAAVLRPTLSAPLILSALSPVSDLKSAYCAGVMPNFSVIYSGVQITVLSPRYRSTETLSVMS